MKRTTLAVAAVLLLAAPVLAQEQKAPTAQQQRMKDCNAEAKKREFKDNDARQAFMSACLKGEMPKDEARVTPQQQRMRDCNEQAGKQQFPSGRERQAFMQKCLRAE
jgi:cytochrome c556